MEQFLDLYNEVFDEDGNIKPCGRAITSRLIMLASKIKPDVVFGDEYFGIMNVENIQKLYKEI